MNKNKCDILSINKSLSLFSSLIMMTLLFVMTGCFKDSGTDSTLMVINVLDKNYYQDCHITGSVNIPFDDFENRMKNLDKQKLYVFYCSNYACMAAPSAATSMKEAGFKNVYVYTGGIVEWYQKKYPYQGPAKLAYLQDENEPLADDDHEEVAVLSADQLKAKMQEAGLLS